MLMRRGVTLVELLVATAIFVAGFSAVIGLFVAGTRLRVQADTTIRASLAAESLVEDIQLDASGEDDAAEYMGDGIADNGVETSGDLFPYNGAPGIWYAVESCEASPPSPTKPSALLMSIIILYKPIAESTLSIAELRQKLLRWRVPSEFSGDPDGWMREELVRRGVALRYKAVIIPRPSWDQ